MSWSATHTAPEAGLQAWSAPDAGQPPVATVDPGLELQVLESRGAWARIVCSNGWEAWVDGRLLVAHDVPAPSARPRLVAGAAALVIVVLVALMARGGGSDHPAGAALVDLHVPAGWSVSRDGLVAAETAPDLTAATPSAPRVRAVVGNERRDPKAMLDQAVAANVTLVEDPAETKVSGVPAVSVTLEENAITRRIIVVRPTSDDVITFTLETPAARYPVDAARLASVPGLASRGGGR